MYLSFSTFNVLFIFLHVGCSLASNDTECWKPATQGRARRCIGFERFPRLRVEQSSNFQPRYITAQPRSGDQEHPRRLERPAFQLNLDARKSQAAGSSHSPGRPIQVNRPGTHPSSKYRPIMYNSQRGSVNKRKPAARHYQEFLRPKKTTRVGQPGSKPYKTIDPRIKNNHNLNDVDKHFPTRGKKYEEEMSPPRSRYSPSGLWGNSPRFEHQHGIFQRQNYTLSFPRTNPKAIRPRKKTNHSSFEKYY